MNRNIFISLFLFFSIMAVTAQQTVYHPTSVVQAIYFDVSPPLHSIPVVRPAKKGTGYNEVPNKIGKKEFNNLISNGFGLQEDPVWQKISPPDAALPVGPLQNFEGINNLSGVYPPDTQGDVGPDNYVQVVNLNFEVFAKDGTPQYGPAALSSIWSGIPAPWNGTNDGDPVVLYDQAADRWIISEFSLPDYNYAQLIAISQTSDPTGPWYRYVFQFNNELPDYPKLAVWPDGYYLSVNQFTGGYSWGGVGACALDRTKMLAGDPTASMVYFNLGPGSDPGSMLPSDWDGTLTPPVGEPNYFTYFNDWSSSTQDFLKIWAFSVNWTNPAASTFSEVASLETAPFKSDLCGAYRGQCIPQPGTSVMLESLSDRLMYRLQYRNFGSYQAMVTNHTVDVDNTGHAGIRWYELRNSGSGWNIYQQGTYAPDNDHRWMGSIAMNANGLIALGYSVTNGVSLYPGIRYTGRRPSDPPGQMTFPEQTIINGSGSQTGSAARWGDYSMMSVDPADDATFWYTQEYLTYTGPVNWQTRIASFKFTNEPTVQTLAATAVTPVSATLNGIVNANTLLTDQWFEWGTTNTYGNSTPIVSAGSGDTNVFVTAGIASLIAGTEYHFRVAAQNAEGITYGIDRTFIPGEALVSTDSVYEITITSAKVDATVISDGGLAVTARGVAWALTSTPTLADNYTTEGSGPGAFTSILNGLSPNSDYFVRAYATNPAGTFYGEQLEFHTPCLILTPPYLEEFENTTIPNCWSQVDHEGNGQIWQFGTITGSDPPILIGNYAYLYSDAYGSGNSQDADLVSPAFDFSTSLMAHLSFYHYFMEYQGSSGTVSYSMDGGINWTPLVTFTSSSFNPAFFDMDIPELAGKPNVKFKWNYQGNYGYFWAVDNVSITAPAAPPLSVLPGNRMTDPVADTTTFLVLTFDPWTANSNQSWCTVTPSGTGIGNLTAACSANPSPYERIATITVTIPANPPVVVTVTQRGLIPPDNLSATVNGDDAILSWNPPMLSGDAPLMPRIRPAGGMAGTAPDQANSGKPSKFPERNPQPSERSEAGRADRSASGGSPMIPVASKSLPEASDASSTLLYDNGPLVNSPGTGYGGADESILLSPLGLYGFGAQLSYGNSMADDFEVPAQGWNVTKFTFYSYQTGAPTSGTITGLYFRIYDGDPSAGGNVIWGDMTTNRMTGMEWSNIYRTLSTYGGADRAIMKVEADVTGLSLSQGIYWVEFQFNGSLSSGPWAPPVTITGVPATGNAKQCLAGTWGDALDGTYQQDMPFLIEGSVAGSPVSGLTGYKLYRDDQIIQTINDPGQVVFTDANLPSGSYLYQVSAVYDLTDYGFPGQYGESLPEGPVEVIITDTVTIGHDSLEAWYPFTSYWETGRTQMLFTAEEMHAAGAMPGNITAIGFDFLSYSSQYLYGFTVRMGQTGDAGLTGFTDGLSAVVEDTYAVPGTGWQYIHSGTPFAWDGVSNIIVEICFANDYSSDYSVVRGTLVPGGIIGHFQDDNPQECDQILFNSTSATPRPNVRFEVSSVTVSPELRVFGPEAGTTWYKVVAEGGWTAESDQSWCPVTPSGTGTGLIYAGFTENDSGILREATITITTSSGQYHSRLRQMPATPPINLTATLQPGNNVNLHWNNPAGNSMFTGFNVYRYGVLLNPEPLTGNSYTDTALAVGSFSYTVRALYGSLESPPAGPVEVNTGVYVIGNGTIQAGWPYYTYYWSSRTQMLYTAAELISAGASAGQINTVGFNVVSRATQTMNNFNIKLANTTLTALTGWVSGLPSSYSVPYTVPGVGWQDIQLSTPFAWDGVSNVIVEVCFANSSYTSNSIVYATDYASRTIHYHADNTLGCAHSLYSVYTSRPNIRFSLLQQFLVPLNLQAWNSGSDAHLSWDPPSPAAGLLGYFVYRNGLLLTPEPVTGNSYDDPGLPNGTYQYSVKAVFPTGLSSPAGPAQVIISILPPPINLIAGDGFRNVIPLNWSEPGSDRMPVRDNMRGNAMNNPVPDNPLSADYYKIYRKTGSTGLYTCIDSTFGYGSFTPATCYVDNGAAPGQIYYYKVTAMSGGMESGYSNEVMATCNSVGHVKNIPSSFAYPELDGIIDPTEWSDATPFFITNTAGVFNPPPLLPVTAWVKKVDYWLFIAVKDLSDITDNSDELGIYFDNNSNGIFDQTDGNLWIDVTPGVTEAAVTYRPMSGTFPYNVNFSPSYLLNGGIYAAAGMNGGTREYEVAINLNTSMIIPVNNTMKSYIFTWDMSTYGYSGYWPAGLDWPAPSTYADFRFTGNGLGAPVTTAGTVNTVLPGTVNVPVTVTGFSDITSLSLRLEYDPGVLSFNGVSNIAPQLSGLAANAISVSPGLNRVMISWSDPASKSLLPDEKMFDLSFTYLSGSSALNWNNQSNGSSDCEYSDALGNPLPDMPTPLFYFNGFVGYTVPQELTLTNIIIGSGQDTCFEALQTIVLAGSGTYFTVQPGGIATLYAGQRIRMYPGTRAMTGGYMLGKISSLGESCYEQYGVLPVAQGTAGNAEGMVASSRLRVWPNPTGGIIGIELSSADHRGEGVASVYNIWGAEILRQQIPDGKSTAEINLDSYPSGIYILKVTGNGYSESVRIIKQ